MRRVGPQITTLPQLQGLLIHDPSGIGRCRQQVYMGISGGPKPCPSTRGMARVSQLVDAGGHAGCNVDHNLGKQQRIYLRDYFMSEAGSVPWQEQMI